MACFASSSSSVELEPARKTWRLSTTPRTPATRFTAASAACFCTVSRHVAVQCHYPVVGPADVVGIIVGMPRELLLDVLFQDCIADHRWLHSYYAETGQRIRRLNPSSYHPRSIDRRTVWRVFCRLLCTSATPIRRNFERSVAHGNAQGHAVDQVCGPAPTAKSRGSNTGERAAALNLTRLNAHPGRLRHPDVSPTNDSWAGTERHP